MKFETPAADRLSHAERISSVVTDPTASGRSALFASWARSMTRYKLDPQDARPPRQLSAADLRLACEEVGPLLGAAEATLDRLFLAVGGAGCCVLFTDRHGVPVDRRGACADDPTFRGWGLWTGAVWSEESEGTNGIGTCLAEDRALIIHRDQHFHARNTGMTCAVAPIHDHRGRLAAAIDVSSCRMDLSDDTCRLIAAAVADAARRIEARHFRAAFAGARIVLAPTADWAAGALLAVGEDDMVIGASHAARVACGITDARIAALLPAQAVLQEAAPGNAALSQAERGALATALARASGNVSGAARSLGVSRATLHRKMRRLGLHRGGPAGPG